MDLGVATKIADENKHSYDRMSEEFSRTRAKFWEELAFLAEHANPGMRVLDIGCGNGRFYPSLKMREVEYTGLDNSHGLLEEARKAFPGIDFVEGDATELPFPDQSFDIAFSFATLHHIPGRELRQRFIKEAGRVLKPGNTFILTVWDLRQPKFYVGLIMTAIKSMLKLTKLDIGDVMLTFGTKKHERYLHAFTENELRKLLTKNGFNVIGMEVVERGSGSGNKNILVVAKKT